jgi:hypothetical protein
VVSGERPPVTTLGLRIDAPADVVAVMQDHRAWAAQEQPSGVIAVDWPHRSTNGLPTRAMGCGA